MASIADIITNAAKFAAGGEQEVQQRAMNKQVLATNQRALDAQSDKELASIISDSEFNQFVDWNTDNDPTKPNVSFRFTEAYQKNPEIALKFLNRVPQEALKYYDESGKLKQGKIAGIRPTKDGRIALEIEREDGRRAPMTRGASSDPNDSLILLTPEQLDSMATNRLLKMKATGAFDNGGTFQRQWAAISDKVGMANAEQRGLLLDQIDELIRSGKTDPATTRAILDMAESIQDDEMLADFAADALGLDVTSILEAYQPEGDQAESEAGAAPESNIPDSRGVRTNQVTAPLAGALPGGLGNALTAAAAATDAGGAIGAHEAMFGEGGSRTLRDIGAVTSNAVAGILPGGLGNGLRVPPEEAAAASSRLGKQLTDASVGLHKRVFGAASDDIRMDEPPPAPPPRDPSAPPTPGSREALQAVQDRITPPAEVPAPSARPTGNNRTFAQRLIDGAEPADPAKSSISPALAAAPEPVKEAIANDAMPPEQRRQAILDAIEAGFAAPNEQQIAFTREYMLKNGYTTPQSLSAAPPAEVMNIAITMAGMMGPDTTPDQRIAAASSIMNFAQFGDPKTSAADVQRLQIDRAELEIKGRELAMKVAEEEGKDAAATVEAFETSFDDAFKRLEVVTNSIPRSDDGKITGRASREGQEALKSMLVRYRAGLQAGTPGSLGKAKAMEQVIAPALTEVLAAHMVAAERADLVEWLTGPIQDMFFRDPYMKLSPDFSDFRVEYKTVGGKQVPKFLYLVTPGGSDAQRAQINMSQLNETFGPGTSDFIIQTIEKTQQLKTPKE